MDANYLYILADFARLKGEYIEAESLYKQSLSIREKIFVLDHPDVASSLYGLSLVYSEEGKHAKAKALYKRKQDINNKTFQIDHP